MATTISEIGGSSIGGYADAYFINRPFGPLNLSAGVGLDVEMNNVTFKTGDRANTGSTGSGNEDAAASLIGTVEAEGTASGTIIGVRFPIEVSYPVSSKLSIGMKLVPMFSALALGRSINFTTDPDSNTEPPSSSTSSSTSGTGEEQSADAIKYNDYFSALGVEAKGLAFEVYPISIQYAF
jgi:hypothetical protein